MIEITSVKCQCSTIE